MEKKRKTDIGKKEKERNEYLYEYLYDSILRNILT